MNTDKVEKLMAKGLDYASAMAMASQGNGQKRAKLSKRLKIDHKTGMLKYWDSDAEQEVPLADTVKLVYLGKNDARNHFDAKTNKLTCKSFDGLTPVSSETQLSDKCGYFDSNTGRFVPTCALAKWTEVNGRNYAPPCKKKNVLWLLDPTSDTVYSLQLSDGKEQRGNVFGLIRAISNADNPVYDNVVNVSLGEREMGTGGKYYVAELSLLGKVKEPGKYKDKWQEVKDFLSGKPAKKEEVPAKVEAIVEAFADDDIPF